ncbi:MAG: glucose-6-phosphate isomerase [Bacteroidetes bacterium]|nr:glucose-6-phosphate isomerase [Bacteroidota bacterium]MBU1580161.1 glucose-6-phosphate isomerase [Bacteroidota bacterium]MBU2465890.1 glucose-6-phosphate isomerase [Bacteroidota bacterium]MBU2557219.1 glucose-6-phosphate isomerase [Bacteroidota bacterium]
MIQVKLELDQLYSFVSKEDLHAYDRQVISAYRKLYNKTGAGNDFLGWIDLPSATSDEMLDQISAHAKTLQAKSEVFVVIGIGGSYLGARAVIEALNSYFATSQKTAVPQIIYAGHQISEDYLAELLEFLNHKEYSMAVISKSGTTTEPAIAFRMLRTHIEKKYGVEEARKRIVAITDKSRGALKQLADSEGYVSYVVPDDVGGRYSVLTAVGLLPIAVAGMDIKALLAGARKMEAMSRAVQKIHGNPIALYAAARQALYRSGKTIEIMVNYEPKLFYFSEWWKQLYGESEGKDQKGIFPAAVGFTTDLHSMGQYIQDGLRNLFETVISVEKPRHELRIPKAESDLDQLNYIAGKRLSEVNLMAELGTTLAHVDGGVPNLRIRIPEVSEDVLGQLIYFFEMGCALSGYMLEVNPFDQPGVEAYKKNMFALLGKEGFENQTAELQKRLHNKTS